MYSSHVIHIIVKIFKTILCNLFLSMLLFKMKFLIQQYSKKSTFSISFLYIYIDCYLFLQKQFLMFRNMNNEVYAKFSEEWYSVPTFRISIFFRKIYKFFQIFFINQNSRLQKYLSNYTLRSHCKSVLTLLKQCLK